MNTFIQTAISKYEYKYKYYKKQNRTNIYDYGYESC